MRLHPTIVVCWWLGWVAIVPVALVGYSTRSMLAPLAWIVTFCIVNFVLRLWRCPSCGGSFHIGRFGWYSPLNDVCRHCGLQETALS